MIIGLPKGLFYFKYGKLIMDYLDYLDINYTTSLDTNKNILNDGINFCVDEACLPVKVFHGHVSYLKDKCDLIITPRIIRESDGKYICPKFCGLPEMLANSIDHLPPITTYPLFMDDISNIRRWFRNIGKFAGKDVKSIDISFDKAYSNFKNSKTGLREHDYPMTIALVGHYYNVYDTYINMNVIKKLHELNVGVFTEDIVSIKQRKSVLKRLIKTPFWSCMLSTLGAGVYLAENKMVDGIVYLSSFQCGIDSVIIDLMKDLVNGFPILVLKLDEHSGEAGIQTRIEAFIDMINRRGLYDIDFPSHG